MQNAGIATEGVLRHPSVHTTLAFVDLSPDGDRSFSFYHEPGADIMLRAEELPKSLIFQARVFHFGSVSLTNEPVREATFTATRLAKETGALISYDPDYSPGLWSSPREAAQIMRQGLAMADIVKVSDTEMEMLVDTGGVVADSGIWRRAGVGYGRRKGRGICKPRCHGCSSGFSGAGNRYDRKRRRFSGRAAQQPEGAKTRGN